MLKINLQRNLTTRGILHQYTFFVKNGFSKNFSMKLINGNVQRLDFSTMEKLCTMFQCTPNDLIEWVPPANEQNAASNPLAVLIRTNATVDVLAALHALPYEKLAEVEKLVTERLQKK
jgi:DNA-binding Xre family transcriptional regulator